MSDRNNRLSRRPPPMNRRTAALIRLLIAGHHDDGRLFARELMEGHVSRAVADEQWRKGASARLAGTPCPCAQADCPRASTTTA